MEEGTGAGKGVQERSKGRRVTGGAGGNKAGGHGGGVRGRYGGSECGALQVLLGVAGECELVVSECDIYQDALG